MRVFVMSLLAIGLVACGQSNSDAREANAVESSSSVSVKQKIVNKFSGASPSRIAECNLATTVMARIMDGQVSEKMIDAQMVFLDAFTTLRKASPEANDLFFQEYRNLPQDMSALSSRQKSSYSNANSSCIREASQ